MELHNSRPLGDSADTITPGTWRCLVCQKPTNQIHVLPCQHKFCNNCLELWAGIYLDMYHGSDGQFPCQICWKLYDVPSQGIQAFVQDYQVNTLEDCMQQMSFGGNVNMTSQGAMTPSPFGQWDAGTTAEAAFGQQIDQGAISPAKTQMERPNFPERFPNEGMIANINCDDEPVVMSTEAEMMLTPQEPSGGNTVYNVSPPGTTLYPSMVSHMAPQPMCQNQENNLGGPRSDYCLRSHHHYMHML